MENIIKKILRESLEGGLDKLEIGILSSLNSAGYDNKTERSVILDFLTKTLGFDVKKSYIIYTLFKNNYRSDSDYSSISNPIRVDPFSKVEKTSNYRARELVQNRIPFKGSNTNSEYVYGAYVVYSYGWYPIFAYKNNQWYENSSKYSVSTSKQKSQLRPYGSGEIIGVSTDQLWSIIKS